MVLYHFSQAGIGDKFTVNPARMGTSVHAGREIDNQFENGIIKNGFLKKSNWFTKDSDALELHRFGYMNCYSTIIPDKDIYNINKYGYQPDKDIQAKGYIGYYLNGQVRLFVEVEAQRLGKIELPRGITFKTVDNYINGANLEDYLK